MKKEILAGIILITILLGLVCATIYLAYNVVYQIEMRTQIEEIMR